MGVAVDWSSAPHDILVVLAEHMPSLGDSLRFGAACRSCASAAKQRAPGTYLPCLLLPDDDEDQGNYSTCDGRFRNLLCLPDQKLYRGLRFPEEARHWRYFGSCHAWLGMVDLDAKSRLLNPMSGALVELPALTTFPEIIDVIEWPPQGGHGGGGGGDEGTCHSGGEEHRRRLLYVADWLQPDENTPSDQLVSGRVPCGYDAMEMREGYMTRMCMSSSDPLSDPSCVVMVVWGDKGELACCKPGDTKWTAIHTPTCMNAFEDVLYHKGNFYAVNNPGIVVAVDGIMDHGLAAATVREVARLPRSFVSFGRVYLVVLPSGELLIVDRWLRLEPAPYKTVGFRLFKLDITSSRPEWQRVASLGGLTLFLGHSSSVLMSPCQVSGACRGNCIYFTEDFFNGYYKQPFGGHDMGIFDLETRSIERYYDSDSQLIMPPPVWILPNPR